ncbi:uncharacterized protein EI90DRAFT_3019572 [Cantharellus anzutake]|uniref:uncharacterized protein n=1 Tax=Cantharellus anzutake TaxID=1750568 RepID=UPI001908E933|nr:uncharacterized protein EI90DRAFT_3019572 [Cantharellus anzutake]KAF8324435.1 hypothetical protein EI90DRAFT_3019572 [Cantharellus anzutake]
MPTGWGAASAPVLPSARIIPPTDEGLRCNLTLQSASAAPSVVMLQNANPLVPFPTLSTSQPQPSVCFSPGTPMIEDILVRQHRSGRSSIAPSLMGPRWDWVKSSLRSSEHPPGETRIPGLSVKFEGPQDCEGSGQRAFASRASYRCRASSPAAGGGVLFLNLVNIMVLTCRAKYQFREAMGSSQTDVSDAAQELYRASVPRASEQRYKWFHGLCIPFIFEPFATTSEETNTMISVHSRPLDTGPGPFQFQPNLDPSTFLSQLKSSTSSEGTGASDETSNPSISAFGFPLRHYCTLSYRLLLYPLFSGTPTADQLQPAQPGTDRVNHKLLEGLSVVLLRNQKTSHGLPIAFCYIGVGQGRETTCTEGGPSKEELATAQARRLKEECMRQRRYPGYKSARRSRKDRDNGSSANSSDSETAPEETASAVKEANEIIAQHNTSTGSASSSKRVVNGGIDIPRTLLLRCQQNTTTSAGEFVSVSTSCYSRSGSSTNSAI